MANSHIMNLLTHTSTELRDFVNNRQWASICDTQRQLDRMRLAHLRECLALVIAEVKPYSAEYVVMYNAEIERLQGEIITLTTTQNSFSAFSLQNSMNAASALALKTRITIAHEIIDVLNA